MSSQDPLPLAKIPTGFRGAVALLAYALRSMRGRVSEDAVGEYRYKNLAKELSTALRGEHRPGMSATVWLGNLCARWGVSAAGDADTNALKVWLPDGWLRWDVALAGVRRTHLERVVSEYGPLLATFAMARESEADALVLDAIDAPDEVAEPWVYEPARDPIYPARHYALWTSTSPLAHGADEKDGNVSRFRCEARFDLLTGRWCDVPFVSANSVRGLARDLLMADTAARVGVAFEDMRPALAHALLSGGQLEAGADNAGVLRPLRLRWRSLFPAADLLGGVIENQVMAGWLRMGELTPVARETAAQVAHVVAPGTDARELAPRLPCVADLFETRQLVRSAHRELEGDGGQMLVKTEVIRAGTRWVHDVALTGQLGACPPLVRSCAAHMLALLRDGGYVGAGAARGYGSVSVGAYSPDLGTAELYLAHLAEKRDAIRALLLSQGDDAPAAPAKGGKGKRVGGTKAVEPRDPGDADVAL